VGIDNRDIRFIEPETVHMEQMKKDLVPLNQRIGTVVRNSDVVMIGEDNHFDAQTKHYTEQIFGLVAESADRKPVVFLETSGDTEKNIKHFDYAVKYCKENGISYYAIDTANKGIPGDEGLYPERDIAMASNIAGHMKNNPDCIGIFIGGSTHCNKAGVHIMGVGEKDKEGYNYESTALFLSGGFRVGTVLSHFINRREVLALSVDTSEELLCLPGKYANFYASKVFSRSDKVMPWRFFVDDKSFDLITFVPTFEGRICKMLGGDPAKKITYIDEETR